MLVVVGSDSRGGAGIAREIETIACLDVRTCLAVSALTVQTQEDALEIQVTQPGLVADQMRAALQANRVAGTKVGMLATAEIIVAAVAAVLREYRAHIDSPDPVLASTSGERFLKQAPSRIMK
ncbi:MULTISPECIES: bifunctional hydroxymethylpyrimidine kinase/phosphomethylpyrimidine kinase [unclassified Mesorhizobium]|uniref:bifunctional hydroxymethylpyrimidine kinase/phosphomethylpyrimidine kinase n=1 Tax=unclassified Mesorhizobium TaxID=325217 RepID=UPI001FDA3147|nr:MULTISPECIES: bifunctional hydroxymethylpyrimidine kinase/phosphomethylpyrimidine kinase [unclassified Mesorhizobium]